MSEVMGHIEVIYGPMFAGKSTELLKRVRRYEHAKKSSLVINYKHDNRYSDESVMSTHDNITKKAMKVGNLLQVLPDALKFNVVAIDEGQFFPQIVQFCEQLANKGVIVIVAALDATFQRKAFGNIHNLLPVAQIVTKLNAVCAFCPKDASFTLRIADCQQIQLIGGHQSYKPVCRACFKHNDKNINPQISTKVKQPSLEKLQGQKKMQQKDTLMNSVLTNQQ